MALVGKPCPTIGGLTFVKGDPLSIPTKGTPIVVELWAEWCGPCRVAFPHLSSLQRKYKSRGLRIVGVCTEDDVTRTRRFVEQQGSNMDYTVAVDSRGEVGERLMTAAGVHGIPHAFIIDAKGIIRHHGHPLEPKFEQVLQQVVSEAGARQGPPASYTTADRAFVAEQRLRRFEQQQQQQQGT
ncbi:hypothetical protein N2152v2_005670 [Parachlorella kessleri]